MTAIETEAPLRRADGVELVGEYEGSGFKEPPSLVRRPDGQVVQLPPLLYTLLEKLDGTSSADQIAAALSDQVERGLSGDDVTYLVKEKLQPLGLVAGADSEQAAVQGADPLLALKFRVAVIPERVSNVLGGIFRPLFFPPVVLAALAGLVVVDGWLFFVHGVAQSVRQSLYHPALFLPFFGLIVLSAAFHEIGHAAACRYGGGHPGKMGCGLYLAWPAFYTDVTDAYRLGRRARLRTDLGGVYFNVIIVLATAAVYATTHYEPILLLVVLQHFEMVHQLLPVVRLDGYYIVADLTGVPDLFTRIGPILRSVLPGHEPDERVTALKRRVRVAVTLWVAIVVPLLFLQLGLVLIHLPRILGTAWDSGVKLYHSASGAFGKGDWLRASTGILQLVVLSLPVAGILLLLQRTGTRGARSMWTKTAGRPLARAAALSVTAVLVAALVMTWVPSRSRRPIRPDERGTITQGIAAIRHLPVGHQPAATTTPRDSSEPSTTSTAPARDVETTTTIYRGYTPTTVIAVDSTPTTLSRRTPTTVSGASPSGGTP